MERNLENALRQLVEGEEAGLNYVYSKTYNYVYLRAKSILKRESDIQQLMQDVYLKMLASAAELKEEQLYGWLGKTVYSLGCEWFRKKKSREAIILEVEKSEMEIRKNADLESTMSVITESMEELPDLYQATFYAFYYDYMSVEEIAEAMHCTKEIVINRLNYIRKYMIKALENFQEEKNIKVSFSIEAAWMALRKWSVEHCMGMTAAQAVYSEICKKSSMKPGSIYIEGKKFAGVNNTVVYHKNDDFGPIREQFEKYAPKTGRGDKKIGLMIGGIALAIALIVGIVLFVMANKDKSDKKNDVQQSQEQNQEDQIDKDQVKDGQSEDTQNEDAQNEDTQNEDAQNDDSQNEDTQQDTNEGEYILPESNTRELTRDDIAHLSKEELRLARNEIFARHGMIFGVEDLDQYFSSKLWYEPTVSSDDFYSQVEMSMIEETNLNLILKVESEM